MATEADKDLVPLLQVVYAAKDFPAFFDSLLRRLKDRFSPGDYNDFASTAVAVMVTHLEAYGLSQLSFNLDRVAADTFLVTSRTLAAATRHTEQHGYKIPPAAAASGDFLCELEDPTVVPATMAKGHRFQDSSGKVFQATDAVLVPVSSTSFTAPVTAGESRELSFTSNGEPNQRFLLSGVVNGQYLADQSVKVFVNGTPWTEVDFLEFEETDQFEVAYTADPPVVTFGDGFAGNIPPLDAEIVIQYRVIPGEDDNFGNISSVTDPETTTITSVDPFLVGGVNTTIIVTAPTGTSGGSAPQPLSEVKRLAPKFVDSRGVAVTQDDYEALVNSFSDPTFGAVSQGYAADVRNTQNDSVTIGHTDAVLDAISDLRDTASVRDTTVTTQNALIDTEVTNITTQTAALATTSTDILASSTVVRTNADLAFSSASAIEGAISTADDVIVDLDAAIDSSAASGSEKTVMKSFTAQLDEVFNGAQGIGAQAASIKGAATALIGEQTTLSDKSTEIDDAVTSINSSTTAITTSLAVIDAATADILTGTESAKTTIDTEIADLLTHLDELFDSDCKANVVNVPVLTIGADGFYTGPSSGLVAAVQTYLDGIKEVTQHVNVISGTNGLVFAVITVRVKITSALVEQEVLANIEASLDNVLKNRRFNDPLYLSAPDGESGLYDLMNDISGIEYVNVSIDGPVANLDADGNLIPGELEVITKGSVTITKV